MCCVKAAGDGFRRRAGNGYMKIETIKKLVEDFRTLPASTKEITIPWAGEPLFHPKFEEIITEFLKDDFCSINLVTNGILFDEKLLKKVVKLSAERKNHFNILFSIDSATPETYKKIKKSDSFHRVLNNIKTLLALRKKYGVVYPTLILQFMLMEENKNEVDKFEKLVAAIFGEIEFYRSIDNSSINIRKDGYNLRVIGFFGKF